MGLLKIIDYVFMISRSPDTWSSLVLKKNFDCWKIKKDFIRKLD